MAARTKGKRRAPLMESDTEAALRRRGTELLGLILIALAALAATMIWTYSPDDPSLFSATDAAPVNALGLIGASLADPLHRALGWAAYGIAAALAVWGLRFVLHAGEARAVGRTIALPVALLLAAAFAATHVPPEGWRQDYGLGGLLGDAALGALLSLSPLDVATSLGIATLLLAAGFALGTGYALGVTRGETRGFLRFLLQGTVLLYSGAHGLTGRAVSGAAEGARAAASFAAEQRARRAEAEPPQQPAPAAPRPAADDGLMAKITEAVRARREADGPWPPPGRRTPPPLTAGANALAVIDEPDPLEAALATPAEPRVQPAKPRALPKSARARSEEEPELALDPDAEAAWATPPLSLLQNPSTIVRHHLSTDALEENARMLETVLDDYGVRGEITSIRPGPVVTLYELEPAAGLKASRVIGLSDDIARSMSALACRVSTIPGRSVIGIELPNELREKVLLREILAARAYGDTGHALPLALGKDIGGEPVVANLARMPHLLIAGTTGSGKSVAINTMILSLLYKLSPDECRLIMIDPKMLELSVYDGIPHLLSPVVTDPKKAVVALKWTVAEMEERYRKMSKMGVRNIDGYNARVKDALDKGEAFTRTVQTGFDDETGEP
ncbi:MAG TPA: DNA translocase FtsK 4TM domain-containing protein, partial [Amaricoccus sp.]|nr:DNA translocase FtsK 4TM domain-containing protein [Amaricoccus sp.]